MRRRACPTLLARTQDSAVQEYCGSNIFYSSTQVPHLVQDSAAMGRHQATCTSGHFPQLTSKQNRRPVSLGHHMFTVPGVLTVQEAQRFIDAAEGIGFKHQSSRGPAFGEAFRDNDRISFQDEQLAEQLWQQTGLREIFDDMGPVEEMTAVGLNPNIRLYRYTQGQAFGKHIDESNEVGPGLITLFTLLIYLSGRFGSGGDSSNHQSVSKRSAGGVVTGKGRKVAKEQVAHSPGAPSTAAVQPLLGGETVFYGNRGKVLASIVPEPGLALLHLHGEDRCLEHEALAVRQGCKYVLRSDVVFRNVG